MNGSLQLCQLTRGYNSALILRWSRRSQGYKCFSLRHKTPSILGRNKSPALANTMKKTQSVHGLLQFEPFQPVQHSPLVKFAAKAAGLVEKWVAAVRFAQVLRADRGQPMDWFLGTPQKPRGGWWKIPINQSGDDRRANEGENPRIQCVESSNNIWKTKLLLSFF
jgi:hypothetical protein